MESFRKLVTRFRAAREGFKKAGRRGEMTLHAVIVRADGTVEDLGLVAKGYIKDFDVNDFIPSEVNDGNSSNLHR